MAYVLDHIAVSHTCNSHLMQPSDAACAAAPPVCKLLCAAQSVVDRDDRENPPPAVAEAKAVLAAQIEAARSKAPAPAQEATTEE